MKTLTAIWGLMLTVVINAAAELPSRTDVSLLNEVATARDKAMAFLLARQEKDGSWNHHPAITGLAITAIARSGPALTPQQQQAVERGVNFILSCVQTNGAIYGGEQRADPYPNYSTAICIMALLATGRADLTNVIQRAREFLLDSQFDEGEGYDRSNPSYGGIGYGKRQRPDLSNAAWAYEAIKLTDALVSQAGDSPHRPSTLHWQKAIAFLSRCQNLPEFNDQPWAKNATSNDLGGFIYMPGDPAKGIPPMSFADEPDLAPDPKRPLRSYGSMTYAGLKSFIYADLRKDDPRVVAAVNWLRHNYTLEENPGLGKQGLYYYYHMMAKALTAYGADVFVTADGKQRDWRYDMMKKLVSLQKADGSWQNDNNRWWENDPVLVTTYCLLALQIIEARRYP